MSDNLRTGGRSGKGVVCFEGEDAGFRRLVDPEGLTLARGAAKVCPFSNLRSPRDVSTGDVLEVWKADVGRVRSSHRGGARQRAQDRALHLRRPSTGGL